MKTMDERNIKKTHKFQVRVAGESVPFVWCESIEEAESDAKSRNDRAVELGIKTRYEALPL